MLHSIVYIPMIFGVKILYLVLDLLVRGGLPLCPLGSPLNEVKRSVAVDLAIVTAHLHVSFDSL